MYHCRGFKSAIIIFLLFFVVALAGAAESDEKYATVVVAKKDNLVNICKTWLENPHDWPAVARFNRMANPHLIFPGQRIKVPARLLKGIPMAGRVSFLKGDVRAWVPGNKAPIALAQGDRVTQGTEIETGRESAVEIIFEDDSSVFLRPETRLNIRTARQRSPYYMIRQLFVPAGRTLMRIKKSTGMDSRFEIHTPSAVSAARGTRFRVSVDRDHTTRTEVLDGVVGVKGRGKAVVVDPGQGTWVKKGRAANAPQPLPEPPEVSGVKPLYQLLPVTFNVGFSAQAVGGRVVVARDADMKDVVVDAVIRAKDALPKIMLTDAAYYCRGTAINWDGLEGVPTPPIPFKVRINPLPPFIQNPMDGARFKTDEVVLEWLKVGDAVSYDIQIARDPEFADLYKEINKSPHVRHAIGLGGYGPYYFRVRSIAGDGFAGLWSDAAGFIHVEPPRAPEAEPPAVDETAIRLRWQDMGPDMGYDFQMSDGPEFKNILLEETTHTPAITFDRPEKGGTYYVRIRAVDPDGYQGEFNPAQTFEIKKFPYLGVGTVLTWIVGALIIIL